LLKSSCFFPPLRNYICLLVCFFSVLIFFPSFFFCFPYLLFPTLVRFAHTRTLSTFFFLVGRVVCSIFCGFPSPCRPPPPSSPSLCKKPFCFLGSVNCFPFVVVLVVVVYGAPFVACLFWEFFPLPCGSFFLGGVRFHRFFLPLSHSILLVPSSTKVRKFGPNWPSLNVAILTCFFFCFFHTFTFSFLPSRFWPGDALDVIHQTLGRSHHESPRGKT